MHAVGFHEHGGPETLTSIDLPTPDPGPGQVRIAVHACALNHLDLWVRRGIPGLEIPLPHVGGSDFAGTVDAVGAGVEAWREGDRVTANPGLWCGTCETCIKGEHSLCSKYRIIGEHVRGGCAECVVVPAANLVKVPDDIPFEAAAAVPLTFQTALRALFSRARLRSDEWLLVLGASGGVAVAAVQLAKLVGAKVIAVTSGDENVSKTRDLGADEVLDRTQVDFAREVYGLTGKQGVDVVLENVGAETWSSSIRSLRRGGRLVTYGATTGPRGETDITQLFWKQISLIGSTMASHSEFLSAMKLFFEGKLKAVISHEFPLENLREAHEVLERSDQFGKVVLKVRSD